MGAPDGCVQVAWRRSCRSACVLKSASCLDSSRRNLDCFCFATYFKALCNNPGMLDFRRFCLRSWGASLSNGRVCPELLELLMQIILCTYLLYS